MVEKKIFKNGEETEKVFTVALVVSGVVAAESSSEAREKLECTLGIFDFVDQITVTMKIKDGDFLKSDFADLLVPTPVDDRYFVVIIDKKHKCPADDRHLKEELLMDSGGCPYVGTFSCPFIAPALLASTFHKGLPRCPFDDLD